VPVHDARSGIFMRVPISQFCALAAPAQSVPLTRSTLRSSLAMRCRGEAAHDLKRDVVSFCRCNDHPAETARSGLPRSSADRRSE
jgi:hypothetical protein